MTRKLAFGIDIGGTNLKIALVSNNAAIVDQVSHPTAAERGPQAVVSDIVRFAAELLARRSLAWIDAIGVGVATPGPLNLRDGRIIKAANLPGWQDVPLRDMIATATGQFVVLENDGNTAAFGEYWSAPCHSASPLHGNNARTPTQPASSSACVNDLVLLTLGTGVGAGVILDGRILHGALDNAAELGHLIVMPDGLPCPCGQHGCLEQYASAGAVARTATQAIAAGESSVLSLRLQSGETLESADVAAAAKSGDALAMRIWDQACQFLAIAVINIQHAYNPALVLLGGGMSAAGAFLLTRVCHHLERQKWSLHKDLPEIRLARLGNDAGVVGAAGLVWSLGNAQHVD